MNKSKRQRVYDETHTRTRLHINLHIRALQTLGGLTFNENEQQITGRQRRRRWQRRQQRRCGQRWNAATLPADSAALLGDSAEQTGPCARGLLDVRLGLHDLSSE